MKKIIETLLEEDYTSFDIAAAPLKFYMAENRLDGHERVRYGGFWRET